MNVGLAHRAPERRFHARLASYKHLAALRPRHDWI